MGLKIGITGGIGSGKTFVSRIFAALGVPVYNADTEAKAIMNSSTVIRAALIAEFGPDVYVNNVLNRPFLAEQVFKNKAKLDKLNGIVHPDVIQAAREWAAAQHTPYTLKEAALLFESGSYKDLDYTILVTSPESVRVKRVMDRDHISESLVRDRISKQMPEEEKMKLADFIIINDHVQPLLPQIWLLHNRFLKEYGDIS